MSLWPWYNCGQSVYPGHVPAVAPAVSKAQVFCCDGELAIACTTFCLLEKHGHTEGDEGLVKVPPLGKRWQTAPFAGYSCELEAAAGAA